MGCRSQPGVRPTYFRSPFFICSSSRRSSIRSFSMPKPTAWPAGGGDVTGTGGRSLSVRCGGSDRSRSSGMLRESGPTDVWGPGAAAAKGAGAGACWAFIAKSNSRLAASESSGKSSCGATTGAGAGGATKASDGGGSSGVVRLRGGGAPRALAGVVCAIASRSSKSS